jgi:hypothetical protein
VVEPIGHAGDVIANVTIWNRSDHDPAPIRPHGR